MTLIWNGAQLVVAAKASAVAGVVETAAACVEMAKGLVLVDTGNLQAHIEAHPPQTQGSVVQVEWGAFDVYYAMFQEIGPVSGIRQWRFRPYLRPAMDAQSRKLGDSVIKNFRVMS